MMAPTVQNDLAPEPVLDFESTSGRYTSRFLEDFEPVRLLGKGAYGLVFEAQKLIDRVHYAVKRIKLPSKKEDRVKVMREVTVLAELNHRNIVRYFHAWCEYPPKGWQSAEDAILLARLSHSSSGGRADSATCGTLSNSTLTTSLNASASVKTTEKVSFASIFGSGNNKVKHQTDSNNSMDLITPKDTLKGRPFDRYLYIQMELCRKDTLAKWLDKRNPALDVHHIFREILQAVHHLHCKGLIHRDLKPSNIFFALDGTIKVGDLGLVKDMSLSDDSVNSSWNNDGAQLAELFINQSDSVVKDRHQDHTDQIGTWLYMSPEQIDSKPYNHKVDVYALALILVELLVPFRTGSERIKVLTQLKTLPQPTFPPTFSKKHPEAEHLLVRMLSVNPDCRPEVTEILLDPWVSQKVRIHRDGPPKAAKAKYYKILVIGDQNTGKTSIIHRYVRGEFLQDYLVTVGAGINVTQVGWPEPDSPLKLNVEFCDIGGEERNRFMTSAFYRKAVGALVVMDVRQPNGFQAATLWKKDLDLKLRMHDDSLVPAILLINKCDLGSEKKSISSAELDPSQVDRYCRQHQFAGWFDTSAKDDININEAVEFLIGKVLANEAYQSSQDPLDEPARKLTNETVQKPDGGINKTTNRC